MKWPIVEFHNLLQLDGILKVELCKQFLSCVVVHSCNILEDSFSESTGSGASGIKRMLSDPSFLHWLSFLTK